MPMSRRLQRGGRKGRRGGRALSQPQCYFGAVTEVWMANRKTETANGWSTEKISGKQAAGTGGGTGDVS